jgi:hypothetical protein
VFDGAMLVLCTTPGKREQLTVVSFDLNKSDILSHLLSELKKKKQFIIPLLIENFKNGYFFLKDSITFLCCLYMMFSLVLGI